MVAILSSQKDVILSAVRAMYTAVARDPSAGFHFPVGRDATRLVGYPEARVVDLPSAVVESFAGVGDPFSANVIDPGDVVLDIGSGSGTDVFISRRLVGEGGRVIALDTTPAMLAKLERNLAAAALSGVQCLEGNAEAIPLPDASVNIITSNGVLNLVPDKPAVMREIFRVLKPGGCLQIADIALENPIGDACRANPQLWAECVVGAVVESQYLAMLEAAGFEQIEVIGHLDYFAASPSAETRTVARTFGARALVLRAAKAPSGVSRPASAWPSESARVAQAAVGGPDAPVADAVLDAYGQSCGALEPMMKTHLRGLESGQVLEVRSDEPAARLGVPAWSRLSGHALVGVVEDDERKTRFYLRRK